MEKNLTFITLVLVLAIFELIMKGIALWRCGRNNELGWYIAIFIINTAGILPLIYIIRDNRRKSKTRASQ